MLLSTVPTPPLCSGLLWVSVNSRLRPSGVGLAGAREPPEHENFFLDESGFLIQHANFLKLREASNDNVFRYFFNFSCFGRIPDGLPVLVGVALERLFAEFWNLLAKE